jgi:1,5-anhydro-D-fructose reductase (1,5-anhydro-D-mannitol-forming)
MKANPEARVFLKREDTSQEVKLDEPENIYSRTIRRFVEAVKGEGQPAATGEDGLRSLAIALAAKEAARTGCSVPVRYQ